MPDLRIVRDEREPRGEPARPTKDTRHSVQFCEDDDFLCETVARYLSAGLSAGEPCLLIATDEHAASVAKMLQEKGFDVAAAVAERRLVMLSARETLDRFVSSGTPDAARFAAAILPVLDDLAARHPGVPVRAFGEMVDLLWSGGNPEAAILLEELWNDLGKKRSFSLLCAYLMGNFFKATDQTPFLQVCRAHDHVAPSQTFPAHLGSQERLVQVALLQQKAHALEHEVALRRQVEETLRKTVQELRGSEAELADFVENAADGLHGVGPDGTILWANQAELDLVGYPREEYVGRNIAEFHADREAIGEILARLARGETLRGVRSRLRRKDGTIRHVEITSNVLFREGEFVRTRCLTRDVTERVEAQREREQLVADLERAVRFSELFVGILGHDLRNPLGAITTTAHYLLRRPDSEKLARPVGRILSSADRMARMIDQVLDFSRIRIGNGLALSRTELDLKELVRRAVDELEAVDGTCAIECEFGGETMGHWDADRISQLVSNLAGNAVQHRTAGTFVQIRVDGTGPETVVLSFRNDGVIPAEIVPFIFEPLHGDTERRLARSSGLGLGLYISHQIAVAHGGSIRVTSAPETGTCFTVELPRTTRSSGTVFALPSGERSRPS